MSAETLLSDAFAILANGAAWTKGANARDANGKPVPILSATAVKWDAFGALHKALYAGGNPILRDFHAAYGHMRSRIPNTFKSRDIEAWNDACPAFSDVGVLFQTV